MSEEKLSNMEDRNSMELELLRQQVGYLKEILDEVRAEQKEWKNKHETKNEVFEKTLSNIQDTLNNQKSFFAGIIFVITVFSSTIAFILDHLKGG